MVYTVSITSQGQISIPIAVRRKEFVNVKKVIISVKDGLVTLEPVKDALSLKGSVKTKKKIPYTTIRKSFESYLAGEK